MSFEPIQPRSMSRKEAKEFKASGVDLRLKGKELKEFEATEDMKGVLGITDAMEDKILDLVYPDLPDTYPQFEASKLALATWRLTFGIPEPDEKNSERSTHGTQTKDQDIVQPA